MNPSPAIAIARMCCLTVIVLSLLGTILVLSFYRPDSAPLYGLATAVGTAIPVIVGWFTSRKSADGKSEPPPAAGSAAVLIVAALSGLLNSGCGLIGAKVPDERAIARGAVHATAEAVRVADQECATYGAATADVELLASCEHHYDIARRALIATASAVDLWDRGETRQSVTCALEDALKETEQLAAELAAKGGKPPPAIADARALVAALGGCDG